MPENVMVKRVTRRVLLAVKAAEADEVRVTGDFSQWSELGIPLIRNGNGEWRTMLSLEPGEYQYRLRVDGEWKDHAEATARVANPFGSENCVLKVV